MRISDWSSDVCSSDLGLDRPYPPENTDLLEEITQGAGIAVSEMPFGWEPRARAFPRRNRLIAGISLGIVVVEAAHRSVSLLPARLAGEIVRASCRETLRLSVLISLFAVSLNIITL